MTLQGVVSQQLIPRGRGRVAAVEVLAARGAQPHTRGKTPQINNVIMTSAQQGMKTMDNTIVDLYRTGSHLDEAMLHSVDAEYMQRLIHL